MKRGAFESVSPTLQVASPAMESVIRPDDYGAGLRAGAKGLEAFADFMGKLGNMANKAYALKQTNMQKKAADAKKKRELLDEYDTYTDKNSLAARACEKNIARINQELAYDQDVLRRSNLFGIWGTPTDGTSSK
jgi:hypothetical protein